ncbi:alpha/beta hydrolase [Pelagibacterium lentulum]|uniref:Alpha/beta hydrolase n=1 Tax=Pelagibacterium lentulum TaxID=2029865 RepID=A0A916R3D1_9HYPH|nr:alpha/beta hydrolase [Pelagibacterium lentulum]GGA34735.1 alpha/beta hydrolase [Pelagibacterium lentulum]
MRGFAVKILPRIVLGLALMYGMVIAGAYVIQNELVFPRRFVNAAPFMNMLGPDFERFTLVTADGEELKAYWKPPHEGRPVVVAFHGNGSVPEPMAARFGRAPWANEGYGVLAFAYRGYPGSTGTPSETGLILDGDAAIAKARKLAPESPLILHGHSLGTGVAVAMSERHASRGLILEAPFSSLPDVVSSTMPFLPGFLLQNTFFSVSRIGSSQAEIIAIVHGERDRVVPPQLGRLLYAAAPHGLFLAIADADHLSLRGMRDLELIELLEQGYPQELIAEVVHDGPLDSLPQRMDN